jgi:hypothetical protein
MFSRIQINLVAARFFPKPRMSYASRQHCLLDLSVSEGQMRQTFAQLLNMFEAESPMRQPRKFS